MYNSQYYTCEQIDERLLQGYLDDYNSQTGQSLTKAEFLTKLRNALDTFINEGGVRDLIEGYIYNGFLYGGYATPTGTPQLPSRDINASPMFFIATSPGTYIHYGNVVIAKAGLHIILWDTSTWSVESNILEIEQEFGNSPLKLLSQKAINDGVRGLIEHGYFHNKFTFGGYAIPTGTPSLPSEDKIPMFFIATSPGTYTNYGGITIAKAGLHVILWDTSTWSVESNILEIEQEFGNSTYKLISQQVITDGLQHLGKDANLLTNILATEVSDNSLITPSAYKKGKIYKVDLGDQGPNFSEFVGCYQYYIAKVDGAAGDSLEDTSKFETTYSSSEALNKVIGYIKIDNDNIHTQVGYYECDTAGATAAKTIAVANYALFVGGSMKVKFANKNTANNATLNINSQGAKALYYQGERASANNSWDAEEVVEIYYDGTSYYANNVKGGSGSGVYDVSKEHPTSGPNSDGKFTLEYILDLSNVNELIPVNKRYPGMTIQFVSTSDNKYVQYRLMSDTFNTTITNWQGVDDEPVDESNNLVKSGGVYKTGWGRNKEVFPFVYNDDSHTNNKERIDFVDDKNNILGTITEKGLKTKRFDSEHILDTVLESGKFVSDEQDSLIFQDKNNNIAAIISKDGLKTKNFDSTHIHDRTLQSYKLGDDEEESLIFQDSNNNVLAKINKDGLKTKNFDSKNIPVKYKGEVTIENSDCITILGSSFGETDAFPENKHWSGIMSLFSDYVIQNLSLSGSNVVTNLYMIRTGQWIIRGRYVAITNNENIHGLNITQYVKALDNLCSTLKGLGKIPIICTNYHKVPYFCMALRKYAYDNNLIFWDASDYCHTLVPAINGEFDDGAHLRKRNAPMVADAYLNNIHEMSTPFSSLKLFNIRDTAFNDGIDKLIYNNNSERAKLFKEIKISSDQSQDCYNKIINKTAVYFGKYSVIDCVLPAFSYMLEELWLELNTYENDISVYVKNTLAEPYPNPTSSSTVRFSISDVINIPSIGDIYSINSTNYTVSQVIMDENGYYCTIYCTPATLPSSQTGTLSVVSRVEGSTGSSSIDYAMAEIAALDISSFISSDNQGHWHELLLNDGKYTIPSTIFNGAIQNDKICFLVVASVDHFYLTDVRLGYKSNSFKEKGVDSNFEWCENDYIHTDELITESTFGEVGTELISWVDDDNEPISSSADYGSKYPFGTTSIICVSDDLAMNTVVQESTLNKFGKTVLEIYCRYFPTAPIPYSQNTDTIINDDSYDYNTLFIKMGNSRQTIELQEEIGVMWKIVRIPLTWFWQYYDGARYLYKSINLRLSSNNKGIEIAKVSLKYM